MKLGLISDLHATLPALDAVLGALDAEGVHRIVCLGDIVDLGPEPDAVVARLRERRIPCVRGNHDRLDEHPPLPVLAKVEAWTRDHLSPEHRAWLSALPDEHWEDLGGARVWCVHGRPGNDAEGITTDTTPEQLEAWSAGRPWDVLVCGHTHVQFARRDGPRTVVNVGSVAQPFVRAYQVPPRILRACDFAVLEGGAAGVQVHLRRLPLPWDAMVRAYEASGFPHPERWLETWVP